VVDIVLADPLESRWVHYTCHLLIKPSASIAKYS
jgi:hypothetical protein